jgi:hypothetical protein
MSGYSTQTKPGLSEISVSSPAETSKNDISLSIMINQPSNRTNRTYQNIMNQTTLTMPQSPTAHEKISLLDLLNSNIMSELKSKKSDNNINLTGLEKDRTLAWESKSDFTQHGYDTKIEQSKYEQRLSHKVSLFPN